MLHLNNPISQCNLKFASEKGEFEGYASAFNSNDQVNDTILPGAFQKSLDQLTSIKMFLNHQHRNIPLGTWHEAKEDEFGLLVKGSINMDHADGPSAYSALKRGDMDGLSIGFTASNDDYDKKSDGGRIYKAVSLREISVVTYPCEPKAVITSVKNMDELETIRDLEHFIREELGASKSVACAFLSHAKRVLSGDLADAQKQIKELKRRLEAKKARESLFNTLEKLGV